MLNKCRSCGTKEGDDTARCYGVPASAFALPALATPPSTEPRTFGVPPSHSSLSLPRYCELGCMGWVRDAQTGQVVMYCCHVCTFMPIFTFTFVVIVIRA